MKKESAHNMNSKNLPASACVIIRRDGRFAAIKSNKHHGKLQLPGGKAEAGETPEQNARRETLEEVGLPLMDLVPVLESECGGFWCTTFTGSSVGDLVDSVEGQAVWVTADELIERGVYPAHTHSWLPLIGYELVATKTLGSASSSPTAAAIRMAIGAGPNEDIEVITPQFTRPVGEPAPLHPPADAVGFDALRACPAEALLVIGLRRWGDDPESKRTLWLFPGEWYASIPAGYEIVNIFFETKKFSRGECSNDIRFGCLSYGVFGPT